MKETFLASLEQLHTMLESIRNELKILDIDACQRDLVELAVEEALVNIINYGYPERKGHIEIECEPVPSGIKITLKDMGIPYNPLNEANKLQEKAKNPTNVDLKKIGGYGICLILHIMSDVTYTYENGNNVFTMIKYYS